MKLVIVGGDAAGMSAASRTKRLDPDFEVVVLEQTGDISYSACGMPYNIADPSRKMDDLVVRHAEVFIEKSNIDVRLNHRVITVNTSDQALEIINDKGRQFSMNYDYLLLATGASPVIPDLPGFDLPGVMALKSLEQGRAIKNFLVDKSVSETVIIGMGYIAMEMCEALRNRDIGVTMVKPGPELLPWLPRQMAETIGSELEKHQVRIDAGNAVHAIKPSGGGFTVTCSRGDHKADMILVAMGVKPNSELAVNAGLALGPQQAIAVDRGLRTSAPHIFAAGDCADAFHVVSGHRIWLPLALRANRAGWAVADQICGNNVTLPGVAGTAVFKVFDLEVARTGLNETQATRAGFDPVQVNITTSSRAHRHPGSKSIQVSMVGDRNSGLLLGVQMVGEEGVAHRINAAAVALHGQMTVDEFTQCDLAYAPPFGPVWDPLLTAANQLKKAL